MPRLGGAIDIPQVSDPNTPAAGRQFLYVKSDGLLYTKRSDGTVVAVGAGVPGGTTTLLDGGATPSEAYTGVTVTSGGAIMPSVMDAKGDLIAASAADTVTRLPVGTTGQVLTVDPLSAVGISWSAPPAPTNMVTTDTDQDILGIKKFISSGGKPQIQFGTAGTFIGLGTNSIFFHNATTTDNGTTWQAIYAGGASAVQLNDTGTVSIYSAPSVAAGATLTFTARFAVNLAGNLTGPTSIATSGQMQAAWLKVLGLTGATATHRIGGATASGAPTTGTFAVGDLIIALDTMHFWKCTVAGTPGTWVEELPAAHAATHAAGGTDPITMAGPTFDLTQEYTTTQPTTPATGVRLFTRFKARRVPTFVGPSGMDQALQPAWYSNKVGLIQAVPFAAATTQDGLVVAQTTAPVAAAFAATNFFTRTARTRFTTAATISAGNGPRTSTAAFFLSSLANVGGFFFVCRFGVAVRAAAIRGFVGLSATNAQFPTSADPMSAVNTVGFGWGSADTNIRAITNGAAADTTKHVDLGALFPAQTAAVDFYEARLFAPSGSAASINWSLQRLNTGDLVQGTFTAGLPVADTPMVGHCGIAATTAAASSVDFQLMYIETDN